MAFMSKNRKMIYGAGIFLACFLVVLLFPIGSGPAERRSGAIPRTGMAPAPSTRLNDNQKSPADSDNLLKLFSPAEFVDAVEKKGAFDGISGLLSESFGELSGLSSAEVAKLNAAIKAQLHRLKEFEKDGIRSNKDSAGQDVLMVPANSEVMSEAIASIRQNFSAAIGEERTDALMNLFQRSASFEPHTKPYPITKGNNGSGTQFVWGDGLVIENNPDPFLSVRFIKPRLNETGIPVTSFSTINIPRGWPGMERAYEDRWGHILDYKPAVKQ